jgi:hypothetical protein
MPIYYLYAGGIFESQGNLKLDFEYFSTFSLTILLHFFLCYKDTIYFTIAQIACVFYLIANNFPQKYNRYFNLLILANR